MKDFSDCGGNKANALWRNSIRNNIINLSKMFDDCTFSNSLLDVGCGRGETISEIIKHSGKNFNLVVGVDGQKESLEYAKNEKITPVQANFDYTLPFKDNSFDVVFSHQVIEHLNNLDIFVKELHRVTKPGGVCILSTENLSSWHNIFAITLGFQEFSNSPSKDFNVANPFWKPWKQKFENRHDHKTIIAIRSLCGLLEVHGFVIKKVIGSGYYPFFGMFGEFIAKLDKTHARHIICKATKE
jgi:SAM-dependent methyltransferase